MAQSISKRPPVFVSSINNAIRVIINRNYGCALLDDGGVKCWGYNLYGQLGDGTTITKNVPVAVSGLNSVSTISTEYFHSCASLLDGRVKCWGQNNYGQLGDGTTIHRNTPVYVSGITNAVSVLVNGYFSSCALLDDGGIKCWGYNGYGQLGDGTTTNRNTPVSVLDITNAVDISIGFNHNCALLSDGKVKCWGKNNYGQLGDGTIINRWTPVYVYGITNAVKVIINQYHGCALLADDTVKCWGRNNYGQLGDGTTTDRSLAVAVLGVSNATDIFLSKSHSCALLEDRTVKCWGYNRYGQLGDGTTINRNTSVSALGVTNAINLSLNSLHSCALLEDKTVKCWGYNGYGRLGDGTTINRNISVNVIGVTDASAISAGEYHSCVLLNDGSIKCWGQGYSNYGQLGDGTGGNVPPTTVKNKLFINDRSVYGLYLDYNNNIYGSVNSQEVESSLNNDWNHVALTYNQSKISLYVNGILKDTKSYSFPINTNVEDIIMGDINGFLDEFAIYNISLNQTEIHAHYDCGLRGEGYCGATGTLPTYTTFTSSETTNFSNVIDITNVTSLTITKIGKGKIKFPSDHSINSDSEDYDTNIRIEDAMIYVNSSALDSSFNDSATLTFYNVDCNKPYVFYSETASTFASILSENQRCLAPLCTNIQCSSGTLTVKVTHFSGFAAGSNANLTIEAEAGIFYPLDPIEFTAEYINSTDGTPISGECNITFDDDWDTEYTMDFDTDYNFTKSFTTSGLHEYNVTCSSANFVTLEANDTKMVSSVDIPEFSIITLGLGLIVVLAGLVMIRKK